MENVTARGFILAFHSHRLLGADASTNDHVGLADCLDLVRRLRIPIVRLLTVVDHLRKGVLDRLAPPRFVSITLDDGADYDWMDLGAPSMYSVLRERSTHLAGPWWLKKAHARSEERRVGKECRL